MGRKSFTTTMLFKRDEFVAMTGEGFSGDRHLRHVLREKTQRNLEKNPDGSPMITIDGEPDLIRNQPKAKQKNQQGYYYEVMTYAYEKNDIDAIKKYLAERYGADRHILTVTHYDEMMTGNKTKAGEKTPHTHFILSFRDSSGKGLRIRQSDFFKDRKAVAALLSQEFVTPGLGRESLPLKQYKNLEKLGKVEERISELEAQKDKMIANLSDAEKDKAFELQKKQAAEMGIGFWELDSGMATLPVERQSPLSPENFRKANLSLPAGEVAFDTSGDELKAENAIGATTQPSGKEDEAANQPTMETKKEESVISPQANPATPDENSVKAENVDTPVKNNIAGNVAGMLGDSANITAAANEYAKGNSSAVIGAGISAFRMGHKLAKLITSAKPQPPQPQTAESSLKEKHSSSQEKSMASPALETEIKKETAAPAPQVKQTLSLTKQEQIYKEGLQKLLKKSEGKPFELAAHSASSKFFSEVPSIVVTENNLNASARWYAEKRKEKYDIQAHPINEKTKEKLTAGVSHELNDTLKKGAAKIADTATAIKSAAKKIQMPTVERGR